MSKNHYVKPAELRDTWAEWTDTGSEDLWHSLCEMVYKICLGVATRFNPCNELEREELAHHAFERTIAKIENGRHGVKPKLVDNGKTSPFNLLTTAIYNTLTTKMKRKELTRKHYARYGEQQRHQKRLEQRR